MLTDSLHHLGDDEKLERLALPYPSHSERSLCVIPESHVFTQSDDSPCIDALMDIHSCRMDLIIKRKAAVDRYASLSKSYNVHSITQKLP